MTDAALKNLAGEVMFRTHRLALPTDKIRYAGEPIAVVVAETAYQARDAAEMVMVDTEELPAMVTAAQAMAKLPMIVLDSFYPPKRPDDPAFGEANPTPLTGAVFFPAGGYVNDPQLSAHNLQRASGALLDRIGMRNTLLGVDRFGDFILSSQVYTNARDLARFGLLYLQNGTWHGERLLSQAWIDFVRTPAPATATSGNFYGGQWWLVPDTRTDVPRDAYAAEGNRGQYVIVVPSRDLVIVRRGLDYGRQGFDPFDLTREVAKAIR